MWQFKFGLQTKLTFFVYDRKTEFERKRIISNDYVLSLTTHIIDR